MKRRPTFLLDVSHCTGCKTCVIACMDRHDLPPGARMRRVEEHVRMSEADGGRLEVFYLSLSCHHCEVPLCAEKCPSGAISKGVDGIVRVDAKTCILCGGCARACPYGAPDYDKVAKTLFKCDCCEEDLSQGLEPACVAACPTLALRFGFQEDLLTVYGLGDTVDALPDPMLTRPNLIISMKKRFTREQP